MRRIGEFWEVPWRGLVAAGVVVLALSAWLASGADAATRFVATTGSNAGPNNCLTSGSPCKTITHALTQAVTSDTIQVAAGTYNLALGETFPLTINTNLTLTGAGAESTILDATGANQRVLTINSGVTAAISGVTITGGHVSCTGSDAVGGGLYNNHGTLTLTNSTVSGNTASCTSSGHFVVGGGLYNNHGTLTLTNSTVSGNTASCTSGLVCVTYGGGISNFGTLTLTNSTVSGNTASGFSNGYFASGGGLQNDNTLTLTNSTVSGNTASCTSASSGCGAAGGGLSSAGTLTLTNSTVSANTVTCSGAGCIAFGGGLDNTNFTTLHNTIVAKQLVGSDCSNTGTLTSNGFNLDSDNTCHLTQPSDKPNVSNPLLSPLQNNGGPTLTHALLPGSPAIDTGTNTGCPSTDQRGVTRPQGAACDIGAFELVSTSSPGPTLSAPRQILNVATFVGPTAPPTPQQQQQAFLTTDPILAGTTYYDPNEACAGDAPVTLKFFVFSLEGQLILGHNRDTTGGVSSTRIGTSKYQALLATLDPGALPAGSYNLVFRVEDCATTSVLVSEFYSIRVLAP